ncbi:MAG: MBL fold metallo-hydrolase [Kiritimatiellae bacterium]|nr:MBL fold metallo-hydrolase [Kiritimatiellia bacterium]
MEICVLGSGSGGNSTCIRSGNTTLLVDAGFTAKELRQRLLSVQVDPCAIQAILFTHEHIDHCRAARVLSHKLQQAEFFANMGTSDAINHLAQEDLPWTVFETSQSFAVGDLQITSFSVSHDCADPVGYLITDDHSCLFYATDLGTATILVRQKFQGCTGAILESNHDVQMLMDSERAWSLKQRIKGDSGHLSNDDAAALVRSSITPELRLLLLAHISGECNTHQLARETMLETLRAVNRQDVRLETLQQDTPSEWFSL